MGEHLGYLVAGYGITWIVLLWYAWRLRRKTRETARRLEARDGTRVAQRGETGLSPEG